MRKQVVGSVKFNQKKGSFAKKRGDASTVWETTIPYETKS